MKKSVYFVEYAKAENSGTIGEWKQIATFHDKLTAFEMIHAEQLDDYDFGDSGKYAYRVIEGTVMAGK